MLRFFAGVFFGICCSEFSRLFWRYWDWRLRFAEWRKVHHSHLINWYDRRM